MKFNIYTAWMDPVFYAVTTVFAASLFFLVYSLRRYVELKNSDNFNEVPCEEPSAASSASAHAQAGLSEPEIPSAQPSGERPVPLSGAGPGIRSAPGANRAEVFVKGIYEGLFGLDARLKNIEAFVSRGKANNDFTVKFLEDILSDLNSLDKEKIKARIEYLLSDLKK